MMELLKREHLPPRIIIYGSHGLGKSTFGSMAPKPVFLQTEDGLAGLPDVPAFALAKSFDEVKENLKKLATEDHNFKTLVVDSLDWLEPLIWGKVIDENPTAGRGRTASGIESYGYGKGYTMALDIWREYLDMLNYLRSERKMMIVQTAHAQIKKFENPQTDPYDRYEIKLHRLAAGLLQENAEMVLFVQGHTATTASKDGFGSERIRAIGSGDRYLYTEERPAFIAKNRFSLPYEIPFDRDGGYWAILAENIPFFNQPTKE